MRSTQPLVARATSQGCPTYQRSLEQTGPLVSWEENISSVQGLCALGPHCSDGYAPEGLLGVIIFQMETNTHTAVDPFLFSIINRTLPLPVANDPFPFLFLATFHFPGMISTGTMPPVTLLLWKTLPVHDFNRPNRECTWSQGFPHTSVPFTLLSVLQLLPML